MNFIKVTLGSFLVLFLAGCFNSQEIGEEKARLELYEMKADLDGMYVSLKKLNGLGEGISEERISKVEKAIKLRESMQAAVADHDHESALVFASDLYDLFPNNKISIKVIRESGLIFYYYQKADSLIQWDFDQILDNGVEVKHELLESYPEVESVYNNEEAVWKFLASIGYELEGHLVDEQLLLLSIVKYQNENKLKETGTLTTEFVEHLYEASIEKEKELVRDKKADIAFSKVKRILDGFADARGYVSKALILDPHFKGMERYSQELEETHSLLLFALASNIVEPINTAVATAAETHDALYSTMSASIGVRHYSPSDVWNKMRAPVGDVKEVLLKQVKRIGKMSRFYREYGDGSISEFSDVMVEFVDSAEVVIDDFLSPRGNIHDYRKAANSAMKEYTSNVKDLSRHIPEEEVITNGLLVMKDKLKSEDVYDKKRISEILTSRKEMIGI
jgi:hypothetical protein